MSDVYLSNVGSGGLNIGNVGGSAESEEMPDTQVTINITSAQLKALATSPPILIGTPGVGKATYVTSLVHNYKFGTNQYGVQASGAVDVEYASGTPIGGNINYESPQSELSLSLGASDTIAGITDQLTNIENQAVILNGPNLVDGAVASIALGNNAGLGYAHGDTGVITTFDGDAFYIIDTVGAGGAVTGLHLDPANKGTSYAVSNNNATSVTTGVGNGALTVNVTAITQGDGTATITLTYRIVPNLS